MEKSSKNAHKIKHGPKVTMRLGDNTMRNWRKDARKKPKKTQPSQRLALYPNEKPSYTLGDVFNNLLK